MCNLHASYIITYSHNNITARRIYCRSPLRPGTLQGSKLQCFVKKGSHHLGILFPWRKQNEKNLPWPFTSQHPNSIASPLSPTECSWKFEKKKCTQRILEISHSQNGTDVRSHDPDHENEWAHPGDSLNVYGKLEALWTRCTRSSFSHERMASFFKHSASCYCWHGGIPECPRCAVLGFCQLGLRRYQGFIENDQSVDVSPPIRNTREKVLLSWRGREMTLESSVNKWTPPVATSGKDLAVAHC